MNSAPSPKDVGPLWMWFTAWSLQGVGVVGANALGIEGDVARFLLMGVFAAVPLVGLYWILRRRSLTSPSPGE
jgi:hypothetical protein